MNAASPFKRRIEVLIGPLEEWRGLAAGTVLEIVSDGGMDSLAVSCSISKTIMGSPSPSTVTFKNLAADTRAAIRDGLTKITVRAGWENTDMHTAFQGSIMSVESSRSGADIITIVQAQPGYGALTRGITSQTFGKGMSVENAVLSLASNLPGVNVDPARIQGIAGTIGNKGWSFAGSTQNALTELADEYGFSWSIQDGVFQAVGDAIGLSGPLLTLNGENGGLVSVSPVQNGNEQNQGGVKVSALYVPGVLPGGMMRVNSSISPQFNGEYRISSASYSLDAKSDAWTMELECRKGVS